MVSVVNMMKDKTNKEKLFRAYLARERKRTFKPVIYRRLYRQNVTIASMETRLRDGKNFDRLNWRKSR